MRAYHTRLRVFLELRSFCQITIVLVFGILLFAQPAPVFAVSTLDQSSPAPYGSPEFAWFSKADFLVWQQGVTPGLSGLLSQVDFYFFTTDDIQLTLYEGAPWQTGTPSVFLSLSPAAVGWNSIDVSAEGFMVSAGTPFTIGLRGFNPGSDFFGGAVGGYLEGVLYLNEAPSADGTWDMGFNTYVDVVPEPSAVYLASVATVIGWTLRRRASHSGLDHTCPS